MRILAYDQSTSVTGYAVLDNGKLEDYGTLEYQAFNCLDFYKDTMKMISEIKPDLIVWENLKGNRNPDIIRKLAEVTAILRMCASESGIRSEEYVPISVKSHFVVKGTGKRGSKTKLDLARAICAFYGFKFPTSRGGKETKNKNHPFFNITDAIALAMYAHSKICAE